jgi:hypothetical protein
VAAWSRAGAREGGREEGVEAANAAGRIMSPCVYVYMWGWMALYMRGELISEKDSV